MWPCFLTVLTWQRARECWGHFPKTLAQSGVGGLGGRGAESGGCSGRSGAGHLVSSPVGHTQSGMERQAQADTSREDICAPLAGRKGK